MAVRAVRGATQLEDDTREHMLDRVAELVTDVMEANGLEVDDFISVIFTATSPALSLAIEPSPFSYRIGLPRIIPADIQPARQTSDNHHVVRRGQGETLTLY